LLVFGSMTKQTLGSIREGAQSSTRQRLWRYGPLLLWLVFISLASTSEFSAANTSQLIRPLLLWLFPSLSEARLAAVHFLMRKTGHFTEYAVLAFLARRAFITSGRAFFQRYWFQLGLLLVVIYALFDELHQSFVPSRTASIYDSVLDVAGGLTVLLVLKLRDRGAQERKAQVAPLVRS
jgi:VanZ family protein